MENKTEKGIRPVFAVPVIRIGFLPGRRNQMPLILLRTNIVLKRQYILLTHQSGSTYSDLKERYFIYNHSFFSLIAYPLIWLFLITLLKISLPIFLSSFASNSVRKEHLNSLVWVPGSLGLEKGIFTVWQLKNSN